MSSECPSTSGGIASLELQEAQLRSAGIVIDERPWANAPDMIPELVHLSMDFTGTVPLDCCLTVHYLDLQASHRVASVSSDLTVVEAIYYDRVHMLEQAISEMRTKHELSWTRPAFVALTCTLEDSRALLMLRDAYWNSSTFATTIEHGLGGVQPNLAIGFRSTEPAQTAQTSSKRATKRPPTQYSSAIDPLGPGYLRDLKLKLESGFAPYVNEAHPEVVYPFFCFESEASGISEQTVLNKLSLSLSCALEMLKQLRDRTSHPDKNRLLVLGATSTGGVWRFHVAFEPESYMKGVSCEICTIWTSQIDDDDVTNYLEVLWIMERMKRWGTDVLYPRIQAWLVASNRL